MKIRLFAALFAASGFALAALNPVSLAMAAETKEVDGILRAVYPEILSVEVPAEATGRVGMLDGQYVFTAAQSLKVMSNKNAPNIDIGVRPQTLSTPFGSTVAMKVKSLQYGSYVDNTFATFNPPSNTWQTVEWNFKSDALEYTQTDESWPIAGEYVATVNYRVVPK